MTLPFVDAVFSSLIPEARRIKVSASSPSGGADPLQLLPKTLRVLQSLPPHSASASTRSS